MNKKKRNHKINLLGKICKETFEGRGRERSRSTKSKKKPEEKDQRATVEELEG